MKKNKKIGLMTHVIVGYPSLRETEELVLMMEGAGVDVVELQIPFSDPIADGPTIMKANDVALANNVNVEDAFELMSQLTQKVKIPLLFMGYYNTVFHYGVEQFCRRAHDVGAAGLIIPDIPLDEEKYEQFLHFCERYDLASIRVLSPTSTDGRIIENANIATGFLYCTAVSGTTGVRSQVNKDTTQFLKRVRKHSSLPIAVGFGISTPEQISEFIGKADVAVVGSAVIEKVAKNGVKGVKKYLEELVAAGR